MTENIDVGTQYTYKRIEIRSYVISLGDDDFIFSAQTIFVTYRSTHHQEGKFQKRDVSQVTCLSKPITQQF